MEGFQAQLLFKRILGRTEDRSCQNVPIILQASLKWVFLAELGLCLLGPKQPTQQKVSRARLVHTMVANAEKACETQFKFEPELTRPPDM